MEGVMSFKKKRIQNQQNTFDLWMNTPIKKYIHY
jgi:hypothetical protein